VQDAFATQVTQASLLQTRFVPQAVPLGAFVPTSAHVDEPVAQLVCPRWHGSAGVQATPAVQATHDPPLHTWFVPQVAPFARFVP
jgi:hypothetical protein